MDRKSSRGFSLVELLVAIFLVSVVLAAAYTVYFGSSKATTMQLQDARMQDNARMAIDRISRNIVSMGFMTDFSKYPSNYSINGLTTKLNAGDSNAAPDNISFAAVTDPGGSSVLGLNAVKGNSILTVQNGSLFNQNDCIAIGLSDTAVISNVSGSILTLGLTSSGIQKLLNLDYPGQSASLTQTPTVINRLTSMTYAIDLTDANHPVLTENGMPIADDIENIQIAYGVDRNNDKRIDAAEWTNSPTVDDVAMSRIRLVRVTVVARTSQEDSSLKGVNRQVPAIENLPQHDVSADGYRRYILSRIIYTANMDLLFPM
jgi:prepilin-type N-terminal cleavage/methylation domain-containing protein